MTPAGMGGGGSGRCGVVLVAAVTAMQFCPVPAANKAVKQRLTNSRPVSTRSGSPHIGPI